jgi:hypothetical protein
VVADFRLCLLRAGEALTNRSGGSVSILHNSRLSQPAEVQAVAVSVSRPALPREPTRVNDDLAAAADPILKGQEAIRLRETE